MILTAMLVTKLSVPGSRFISYLWSTDFQPFFSLAMGISAALLGVFLHYVKNTYRTSPAYPYAAAALVLGILVTATVPYSPSQGFDWFHNSGTVALLLSLPVLLFSFAGANKSSWTGKMAYVLFALEVIVILGGSALLVLPITATVIEPGSLFILSVWIIAVTVHTPAHERKEC